MTELPLHVSVIAFPAMVLLLVVLFAINLDKERWKKVKRLAEIARVVLVGASALGAIVIIAPPQSDYEDPQHLTISRLDNVEKVLRSLTDVAASQEKRTANIETALDSLVQDAANRSETRNNETTLTTTLTSREKPANKEDRRTENLEMKWNRHCARNREVVWEVHARAGWSIDVGTVKISKTSRDQESEFQAGKHEISEKSVVVKGILVNSGDCIRLLGKVVSKDARGHLAGTLTFVEKR